MENNQEAARRRQQLNGENVPGTSATATTRMTLSSEMGEKPCCSNIALTKMYKKMVESAKKAIPHRYLNK